MSADNVTEMDTDAVRAIASGFGTASNVLTGVSAALEVAIRILQTTAFMGLVGGTAVVQYLEQIKPKIDDLAAKCDEMNTDLNASVDAFERGDAEGATRFY